MDETSKGRRRFVEVLIGLGGLAAGALLAVPGVATVVDPLVRRRRPSDGWRPIADASALRDDAPVSLPVIGDQVDAWTRAPEQRLGTVWLVRRGDGAIDCFTAECPHLGCRIGYSEEQGTFFCPCHESSFGTDGSVRSGPSPRPMDRLEARVRDGKIEVQFRRFRTAIPEQKEIG